MVTKENKKFSKPKEPEGSKVSKGPKEAKGSEESEEQ